MHYVSIWYFSCPGYVGIRMPPLYPTYIGIKLAIKKDHEEFPGGCPILAPTIQASTPTLMLILTTQLGDLHLSCSELLIRDSYFKHNRLFNVAASG